MKNQEQFIEDFKQILTDIDLSDITCIMLTGSASRPFIEHSRDIDVHAYVKASCRDKYRNPSEAIIPIRKRAIEKFGLIVAVSAHWDDEYTGDYVVRLAEEITDYRKQKLSLRCYCYECFPEYCPPIYGDPKEILGDIDILGKDKIDYLKNLKFDLTSKAWDRARKKTGMTKRLYHTLIGIYIIENNSYTDFTEEQIKNINLAHDKSDKEKWLELYDWAGREIDRLLSEE